VRSGGLVRALESLPSELGLLSPPWVLFLSSVKPKMHCLKQQKYVTLEKTQKKKEKEKGKATSLSHRSK